MATHELPMQPVIAVLKEVGYFEENRTPAVQTWFEDRVSVLPEQMRQELLFWFDICTPAARSIPEVVPEQT